MSRPPITFQEQEALNYFNLQPSSVKGTANTDVQYYKRMLYTKLYSVFKFTLPADWDLNWFRLFLFHFGSLAVINTEKFGWIAYPYGVTEYNLYYNPKKITVTSAFLDGMVDGVIGENAEIIRIMDDYFGLDHLITKYATQLSQCDKDIEINLMNANVSLVCEAENKKEADSVREAFAKATTGEPFVAINKDLLGDRRLVTLINNVSQNFIADKLLDTRRGIMNAFLTEIGIKNANLDKKERLNSMEVESNTDETKAIISVIFENLQMCFDKVNNLTGLGLAVEFRYDYKDNGGDGDE